MEMLAEGARVEMYGLQARPELNAQIGKVLSYDYSKARYAVALKSGESVLLKRANLLSCDPDDMHAQEVRCSEEIAACEDDCIKHELRCGLLEKYMLQQHRLKEEAAELTNVLSADSREDISREVYERAIDLQRSCQMCESKCLVQFPELQIDAVKRGDAQGWSRASALFAQFLAMQNSSEEHLEKANELATQIVGCDIHGCLNSCRDATRAIGVLQLSTGVTAQKMEDLMATAPPACPQLNGDAWENLRCTIWDALSEEDREKA